MATDLGKIAITLEGSFEPDRIYNKLEQVTNGGSSYTSIINNNNQPLTNLNAWQISALKGDNGLDGINGINGTNAQSFNLKGSISNYAGLPSSGNTLNDAYYNKTDKLVYVYNGTSFPINGDGIDIKGSTEIPDYNPALSYVEKSTVIHDNSIWRVVDGQTATIADVPGVSDKWKSLGAKISQSFDPETETEAQGGKQIADWVNANINIVRDETIIPLFDYALLNDGSYANLGANYKHTDDFAFTAGDNLELRYYTDAILGGYVGIFDTNGIFIEMLFPETVNNGGWRVKSFRPTTNGKLRINSNFSATKGLPSVYTLSEIQKFAKITDIEDSAIDIKAWVAENKKIVREETVMPLFPYALLDNGSYLDLGSNFNHTDYYECIAGSTYELTYYTDAVLGCYVGVFNMAGVFVNGLFPETVNNGGWRTKVFQPSENCKIRINSNYSSTKGLPKVTLVAETLRFLTPESGGGGGSQMAKFYKIDEYYQDSDAGNYSLALGRIHDIMTSKGGIIEFGIKDYRIDTKVKFTKNVIFKGQGKAEFYNRNWMTGIYTTSPTIDMIEFAGGGNVVAADGIHFYNASILPTAGSAISMIAETATGTGNVEILKLVSGAYFQNCSFDGFYDNLNFIGACQFNMYNVTLNYAVRYNLNIDAITYRDAGDSTIIGCNFYSWKNVKNRTTEAHIYQTGSGGLKIVGNKFNNLAKNCYLGNFLNNETSILLISANSFENYSENAIKITSSSINGNIFRYASIQGNEFASYNDGTNDINFQNVKSSSINGNVFLTLNTANTAINLNGCSNIQMMNVYDGYNNPKNIYNSTNIKEAVLQDATGTNINK